MRRTSSLGLSAIAALSACASPPHPAALQPHRAMSWAYYETADEGAKLAFGAEGTDDVPVMLVCPPGSGQVQVWASTSEGHRGRTVWLFSGATRSRLAAAYADEASPVLIARTRSSDPALRAFAASGKLVVGDGQDAYATPAPDRAPVQAFMRRCG